MMDGSSKRYEKNGMFSLAEVYAWVMWSIQDQRGIHSVVK